MSTKFQKFRRFAGRAHHTAWPREAFLDQNQKAAALILEHAQPSDESLAVLWARRVLSREQHGREHDEPLLRDL
jgi:hypothetical protein